MRTFTVALLGGGLGFVACWFLEYLLMKRPLRNSDLLRFYEAGRRMGRIDERSDRLAQQEGVKIGSEEWRLAMEKEILEHPIPNLSSDGRDGA